MFVKEEIADFEARTHLLILSSVVLLRESSLYLEAVQDHYLLRDEATSVNDPSDPGAIHGFRWKTDLWTVNEVETHDYCCSLKMGSP